MSYQGLGDNLRPTAVQNFQTLSSGFRKLTPQAFHDERLVTSKRRADVPAFAAGAKEPDDDTSNASELDLAVFLLVRGHLEGQL